MESEQFEVVLEVGGYRLEYLDYASSSEVSLLESKLLFNTNNPYACRGEKFMSCDMKDFTCKLQCQ